MKIKLIDAIKTLKSVTRYSSKKPDWRLIIRAIDGARHAPCAHGLMSTKFILVSDKDKISKQRKAYRLQHIKYLRAWAKEYGKRNRKKITKKYLERLKTDPNFRLICYARSRMNFFLKGRKSKTTMELLGVPNLEFLWQHLEKQFQLGMTKENYGKWHVDHIIPCASFDFSDPEQQKKCFHYTNLQPLWASDNISKGSKIISGDITSPKM